MYFTWGEPHRGQEQRAVFIFARWLISLRFCMEAKQNWWGLGQETPNPRELIWGTPLGWTREGDQVCTEQFVSRLTAGFQLQPTNPEVTSKGCFFSIAVPSSIKGRICLVNLYMEKQIAKQMKLWFVIVSLAVLKDFCQQVPTPSQPRRFETEESCQWVACLREQQFCWEHTAALSAARWLKAQPLKCLKNTFRNSLRFQNLRF